MAEMTPETIVASCKANGGYAAPRLNDQLYLHCKGFARIQNLEPYTATKVLWLEQNSIRSFEGLEGQRSLVSLFLHNNTICSLRSLTFTLPNLRILNVSNNYLESLKGLGTACPMLETLQASHNHIASLAACEDLFPLAGTLTSVDLSFNRIASYGTAPATEDDAEAANVNSNGDKRDEASISVGGSRESAAGTESPAMGLPLLDNTAATEDPLALVNFFKRLPGVSVVYLQGNSIAHGIKHYRRNMILHLPQLTYLDERPVFDDERRVVEAWAQGGAEAESAARAAIREEKRAHLNSCVRVLTDKMQVSRELRERLTRQWEAQRAKEIEALTALRRNQREAREAMSQEESAQRDAIEGDEQAGRWDAEDTFHDALTSLQAVEARHRHDYEQALAVQAATEAAAAEIAAEESARDAATAATAPAVQSVTSVKDYRASAVATATATAVEAEECTAALHERSAALAELMRSDDDILREMEQEIDSVLSSFEPSVYGAQQQHEQLEQVRRASQSRDSGGFSAAAAAAAGETLTRAAASAAWHPYSRTTAKMGRAMHAAVETVASKLRERGHADPAAAASPQSVWRRFDDWERRQRAQ